MQGGGVIDLMNRRLQQRLTEPEVLKIFGDVCEVHWTKETLSNNARFNYSFIRRLHTCITAHLLYCTGI